MIFVSLKMILRQLSLFKRPNSPAQRFNLHELSGAFGDIPTLLPLLLALSVTDQVSFSASLFFSGIWNIVTGYWFGIPIPVQPMKSIAAGIIRLFFISLIIMYLCISNFQSLSQQTSQEEKSWQQESSFLVVLRF